MFPNDYTLLKFACLICKHLDSKIVHYEEIIADDGYKGKTPRLWEYLKTKFPVVLTSEVERLP